MKTAVHPEVYDVVYLDTSTGDMFITTSTKKSDETVTVDGKEYFVLKVEISSASHPFYTGKQKLLDTAGRIDKFKARLEKSKKMQSEASKNVEMVEEEEKKEEVKEVVKEEKAEKEVVEETVEENKEA